MDSLPVPEVQIVECGANSESGGRGIGREGERERGMGGKFHLSRGAMRGDS